MAADETVVTKFSSVFTVSFSSSVRQTIEEFGTHFSMIENIILTDCGRCQRFYVIEYRGLIGVDTQTHGGVIYVISTLRLDISHISLQTHDGVLRNYIVHAQPAPGGQYLVLGLCGMIELEGFLPLPEQGGVLMLSCKLCRSFESFIGGYWLYTQNVDIRSMFLRGCFPIQSYYIVLRLGRRSRAHVYPLRFISLISYSFSTPCNLRLAFWCSDEDQFRIFLS